MPPDEVKSVFLMPGDFKISQDPYIISTILGSCVSVCLYHTRHQRGGMNHFMLPKGKGRPSDNNGKYGDYAIGALIKFMEKTYGSLREVVGMIVGGASMFNVDNLSGAKIGESNIALARQMLAEKNIRVIREEVGGRLGVKLCYHNWDNQLLVTPIQPTYTPMPEAVQKLALESAAALAQKTVQSPSALAQALQRARRGI